MASLRFTFDGDKRPERPRPMPFFPPRRREPDWPYFYSTQPTRKNQEEMNAPQPVPPEEVAPFATSPPVMEEELLSLPEQQLFEQQEISKEEPLFEEQKQQSNTAPPPPEEEKPVNVSAAFVAKLDTAENHLNSFRNHVDTAKIVFDDVLFKLDSFLQIMEIMRANEERKLNPPQAQIMMQKTSQDTVDEVLQLLQTPAMQNILRQFLVNTLVKK